MALVGRLPSSTSPTWPALPRRSCRACKEGQFTLSVNFNALDPGQQELRARHIAQEPRTFKVTFVDGGIANFTRLHHGI